MGDKRKTENVGLSKGNGRNGYLGSGKGQNYSITFLSQSSPASSPATSPELQKVKAGTRRIKNYLSAVGEDLV